MGKITSLFLWKFFPKFCGNFFHFSHFNSYIALVKYQIMNNDREKMITDANK